MQRIAPIYRALDRLGITLAGPRFARRLVRLLPPLLWRAVFHDVQEQYRSHGPPEGVRFLPLKSKGVEALILLGSGMTSRTP